MDVSSQNAHHAISDSRSAGIPNSLAIRWGGGEEPNLVHFSPGGKYVIRYYYPARFYAFYNEMPRYIRLYRVSDGEMLYESQVEDLWVTGGPIEWYGGGGDASKPLKISIGMNIWVPFTLPPE